MLHALLRFKMGFMVVGWGGGFFFGGWGALRVSSKGTDCWGGRRGGGGGGRRGGRLGQGEGIL